jgi:hypothetical protein
MSINLDHMSYLVIRDHRDGALLPERMLADTDRATTIKDIASGQFGEVLEVVEWNPVERICRVVTADVMAEVAMLRDDDTPQLRHATQEQMWDWQRGHLTHEVA